MNWFKNLFRKCDHEYEFVRNIYGDEINACGGYRSIWECKKCGKIEYREYLEKYSIKQKLNKFYNEYYDRKYKEWKVLRYDSLKRMYNSMEEEAKKGNCFADFILLCYNEYNDKNYYDKWFTENQLHFTSEEFGEMFKDDNSIVQYKFHVTWR